jgi:streptomycin 3"-adenylyltransferase
LLEQTDQIASLERDVLGPDAIGAYLHGSAVLGGLQPRSDIDVLVVSRRATTSAEKLILVDRLLPISGDGDESGRSRSVELTIGVESDIRPWRYPPRLDFLCGDWLRGEFERGNLANR